MSIPESQETQLPTCYRHPDRKAGVICQRCDRPICPQCMHQASVGFHCPECTKQGAQKVYRGPQAFGRAAGAAVTKVLIGINVAVFLAGVALDGGQAITGERGRMMLDGGLIAKAFEAGGRVYLGDAPPGIHGIGVGNGEWWRMISSGFLHYGILHLGLNMWALFVLGSALEQLEGRARMATVYGVGLLGGGLGALLLSPGSLTAGASGAIFGLMGGILLAQRARGVPFSQSPLIPMLVINALITIGLPGISIGGHLGGLVGGGLAGFVLFDVGRRPGLPKYVPFLGCAVIAMACVVAGVAFASGWQPS